MSCGTTWNYSHDVFDVFHGHRDGSPRQLRPHGVNPDLKRAILDSTETTGLHYNSQVKFRDVDRCVVGSMCQNPSNLHRSESRPENTPVVDRMYVSSTRRLTETCFATCTRCLRGEFVRWYSMLLAHTSAIEMRRYHGNSD